MKKISLTLLILLVLSLSACGKEPLAETLPVETESETTASVETKPEVAYLTAEVNGIPAVLETLSRGDTVDIVEAFDEKHYVVKLDEGYGLVEKNLVRLESEPAYEAWTGYSYHNTTLFDNYRLTGDPVKNLASNTKLEVLEDLGWCLLVELEGKNAYVKPENLARNPIIGSRESNGGDSKKEGSFSEREGTGEDGGDIWLQHSGNLTFLATITPQKGNVSGKATVLADGTDVVLGYFHRGDLIPVIGEADTDGRLTVSLDGLYATVSGDCILAEGEEPYEQWEGRSTYGAALYEDYWMLGSPVDRLNADKSVTVLYELENCYLVEAGNVTGYVGKNMVTPVRTESIPEETAAKQADQSEKLDPMPTKPSSSATAPDAETTAPTETEPTVDSSAENAGTDTGKTDLEWTPPVL